ncbi:MAG: hypothetical protein CM1200mP10_09340 [Candidatus Neomarinimicrobiota bacterium]|nr:MAG: hypothetical protein CM1200mP10_09340 [Candidatus Neomarinimicrobiota bacterium]
MTYAGNYVAGLKPREKDQKILEDMPEDGIGLSIFISDLEDACQQGDAVQVQEEAAGSILRLMGVQPFWRFWLNWPCKM